jgi:hypothetical protein
MIEFGISDPAAAQEGQIFVIGRCVTDIKVGDRFTTFIPHRNIGGDNIADMKFVCDDAVSIDLNR